MKKETGHEEESHPQTESEASQQSMTVGMDLGGKISRYCALNQQGEVAGEGSVATTKKARTEKFGGPGRTRIAMEVGTHSTRKGDKLERASILCCCGRSGTAARKRKGTCWRFASGPRWWMRAPA